MREGATYFFFSIYFRLLPTASSTRVFSAEEVDVKFRVIFTLRFNQGGFLKTKTAFVGGIFDF